MVVPVVAAVPAQTLSRWAYPGVLAAMVGTQVLEAWPARVQVPPEVPAARVRAATEDKAVAVVMETSPITAVAMDTAAGVAAAAAMEGLPELAVPTETAVREDTVATEVRARTASM
jgi:hypothetical protein